MDAEVAISGLKLDPDEAERAAAVIEMLLHDLKDLRGVRDRLASEGSALRTVGARVDLTEARVVLLDALSKATLNDLKGDAPPQALLSVKQGDEGELHVTAEFWPALVREGENPLCHYAVVSAVEHIGERMRGQ